MKDILAQPIQIGHLQAKNRILMPPMYRPWSSPSGKVLARHVTHYQKRAEGGVGTIVVETTAVRRNYRLSEANIGIWADEHIEGLSKIARVIRSNNVLAFIQINHTPVDRPLTSEEMARIRDAFVAAAQRTQKADFQGVELHAAPSRAVAHSQTVFPLPPLKFRTSGFPQYGFKQQAWFHINYSLPFRFTIAFDFLLCFPTLTTLIALAIVVCLTCISEATCAQRCFAQ